MHFTRGRFVTNIRILQYSNRHSTPSALCTSPSQHLNSPPITRNPTKARPPVMQHTTTPPAHQQQQQHKHQQQHHFVQPRLSLRPFQQSSAARATCIIASDSPNSHQSSIVAFNHPGKVCSAIGRLRFRSQTAV